MLLASGAHVKTKLQQDSYSDMLGADRGSEGGLQLMDTWLSDIEHAFERTPGSIKRREIMAVKQKEDLGAMWRAQQAQDAYNTDTNETRNNDISNSTESPTAAGASIKDSGLDLTTGAMADAGITNSGDMTLKIATSSSEKEDACSPIVSPSGTVMPRGSARTASNGSSEEAQRDGDRRTCDSGLSNDDVRGESDVEEGVHVTAGDKRGTDDDDDDDDVRADGEDAAGNAPDVDTDSGSSKQEGHVGGSSTDAQEQDADGHTGAEVDADVVNGGTRDAADNGRVLSPSQKVEIDRVNSESGENGAGYRAGGSDCEEKTSVKAKKSSRSDDDDDDEVDMCVCVNVRGCRKMIMMLMCVCVNVSMYVNVEKSFEE
jgi:hypothetical protein